MKLTPIFSALLAVCIAPTLAFAEPDPDKGAKVFKKKCGACHAIDEGKNKVGPSLYGIVDNEAAQTPDFKYSDAMIASGITWDEATLAEYLKKPKALVKGTNMAFAGLKKQKDIDNLIAFLKQSEPAE